MITLNVHHCTLCQSNLYSFGIERLCWKREEDEAAGLTGKDLAHKMCRGFPSFLNS